MRSLGALLVALVCVFGAADAQPAFEAVEAFYPEGAYWFEGKLYYAEMGADRVSVLEAGARRDFFVQRYCGPTAIAAYGQGFLVLCHLAGKVVEIDRAGQAVREWDADVRGNALRDPNDGFADGHGGVFFSDPGRFSKDAPAEGYVMHLSADGTLRRVAGPLWYPNGVYVAGSSLYVTEHMRGRVFRYAFEADGRLSHRRVAYDIGDFELPQRYEEAYREIGPDGLEIGPDGDFYQAIYGAGLILRISPAGELLGTISTPARYVTNISFDDAGGAYVVGSFDNIHRPFPGEVRYFSPDSLTGAPQTPSSAP